MTQPPVVPAVPPRGPDRLAWFRSFEQCLVEDFAAQRQLIAGEACVEFTGPRTVRVVTIPSDDPAVESMLDDAVAWWMTIIGAAREVEQMRAWWAA
jgi:hypothetical protein